ncbi:MAG: META domain-containing protein [Ginsengibacter sp.]
MKNLSISLFVILAASFLFSSCAQTKVVVSKEQVQNKWMILTIAGVANEKISADAYIDLSNNAKSGAKAGCNQLFFSYELAAKNKIKFSDIGSTRMACPDMTTEDQLIKLFPFIDNVEIRNNMLVLKIGNRDAVTAKRA